MLTSVKLPRELHAALENAARAHGFTKRDVMRRALRSELARLANRRRLTAWELGKDLFGRARSGRSDLSALRARQLMRTPRGRPVRG